MFRQGSKQQRSIIFNPIVTTLSDELMDALLALFKLICRLEVLGLVPVSVGAALHRLRDGTIGLNAEKEVDGGLLIGICCGEVVSFTSISTQRGYLPRSELV